MNVTRINQFQAAEVKSDELFAFLKSLIPQISSSAGCQSCEVLQSDDDAHQFVVIEKWDSKESHQQAAENIPPEQIAAVMPLLTAPPQGTFYHG